MSTRRYFLVVFIFVFMTMNLVWLAASLITLKIMPYDFFFNLRLAFVSAAGAVFFNWMFDSKKGGEK